MHFAPQCTIVHTCHMWRVVFKTHRIQHWTEIALISALLLKRFQLPKLSIEGSDAVLIEGCFSPLSKQPQIC